MNRFDEEIKDQQLAWRVRQRMHPKKFGTQNGKMREWILPNEHRWDNVYPPVREAVKTYLEEYDVSPHTGMHNLKSSWVQAANTYFPFAQSSKGRKVLAEFLNAKVRELWGDVSIAEIESLHLEYAEEGALSPEELLGEREGSRGKNQTSPDIGIRAIDEAGKPVLFLIENKWTEHSFYECSAWQHKGSTTRVGNPDPNRCKNMSLIQGNDVTQHCHQEAWQRRYWSVLQSHRSKTAFAKLNFCPAMRAGYQLFRQQALAEGIAQSGKYAQVFSCVALDPANATLLRSMRSTGINDVRKDWAPLWKGKTKFFVFTHPEWVQWVRDNDPMSWSDWLGYMNNRYGW